MKACVLNSGSSVMTIPRVIALNHCIDIDNFIELGEPIKEHKYIETACNINVEFFPKSKLTAIKLSKRLRKLDKDIYIVFYSAGIPLTSAILANDKPIIGICMGSDVRHFTSKFSFTFKRRLWRNTDLLVAKSKNLKDILLTYCNKLNIDVNYWGIDTSYFYNITKEEARDFLNLPSKYIILSPRAFTELYSIDLIVDSFINYKKLNIDSFLLLIGRTPNKDYLKKINQKLKNADLIEGKDFRIDGTIEYNKVSNYYYASDVALSFAKTEGFPTTLFELFQCKCPTIIGEIPSLNEEIIKDKRDVLFSKFTINDISENIHKIFSDKVIKNKLIDNGLKTLQKHGKIENNAVLLFGKLDGLKHKKSIVKHYQTLFIYFMMIVIDKMHKHI
jgi:glycosyltransferase involved in cell wall biosynthesis